MSEESKLDGGGIGFLLITAIGWGIGWAVFKFLLHDWPPFFARGIAGLLAAVGLASIARARGESLSVPRHWYGRLAFLAFVNVFVWMGFTALSLNWLHVSEGALLTYTMPIWVIVLAWPLCGERPDARDIASMLCGFCGILLLTISPEWSLDSSKLPGVGLALSAAVLFAFGSIRARGPLSLPPIAATAWQVAIGCLPMATLGWLFEHPRVTALSPSGAAALFYVAAVPMALCYLAWFAALRRLPVATAGVGLLLVPITGTISASLGLGEPMGIKEVLALAVTLTEVTIALMRKQRPKIADF